MDILSGSTIKRFESEANHRTYAEKHGYKYFFDAKQRELISVYDHKMYAILEQPVDDSWCFWMDDDAFFMQMDVPLEGLINDVPAETNMIFASSPINPNGGWTYLSSGNFFFKRTQAVHDFFASALELNLGLVRGWWNEEKFGMFTNGDQDKIVFQLEHQTEMRDSTQILPYSTFNLRPYHFSESSDEHFLVHFATPGIPKAKSIADFRKKFGFSDNSLTNKKSRRSLRQVLTRSR